MKGTGNNFLNKQYYLNNNYNRDNRQHPDQKIIKYLFYIHFYHPLLKTIYCFLQQVYEQNIFQAID